MRVKHHTKVVEFSHSLNMSLIEKHNQTYLCSGYCREINEDVPNDITSLVQAFCNFGTLSKIKLVKPALGRFLKSCKDRKKPMSKTFKTEIGKISMKFSIYANGKKYESRRWGYNKQGNRTWIAHKYHQDRGWVLLETKIMAIPSDLGPAKIKFYSSIGRNNKVHNEIYINSRTKPPKSVYCKVMKTEHLLKYGSELNICNLVDVVLVSDTEYKDEIINYKMGDCVCLFGGVGVIKYIGPLPHKNNGNSVYVGIEMRHISDWSNSRLYDGSHMEGDKKYFDGKGVFVKPNKIQGIFR